MKMETENIPNNIDLFEEEEDLPRNYLQTWEYLRESLTNDAILSSDDTQKLNSIDVMDLEGVDKEHLINILAKMVYKLKESQVEKAECAGESHALKNTCSELRVRVSQLKGDVKELNRIIMLLSSARGLWKKNLSCSRKKYKKNFQNSPQPMLKC